MGRRKQIILSVAVPREDLEGSFYVDWKEGKPCLVSQSMFDFPLFKSPPRQVPEYPGELQRHFVGKIEKG
jgi:hypothetical protein